MNREERKKPSLPVKLSIALVLGVIVGFVFKENCAYIGFIGTVFIRLLKMCVYPLVLFSIISGWSACPGSPPPFWPPVSR